MKHKQLQEIQDKLLSGKYGVRLMFKHQLGPWCTTKQIKEAVKKYIH